MCHQAVKELIVNSEEKRRKWHSQLADYYESRCSDDSLVVDELPHQLLHARLYTRSVCLIPCQPRPPPEQNLSVVTAVGHNSPRNTPDADLVLLERNPTERQEAQLVLG